MRSFKNVLSIFTISLFILLAISCGKDPVSVNDEPPVVPDLSLIQPSFDFFTNNPPQIQKAVSATQEAYIEAYYGAFGYGLLITTFSQIPNIYLEIAQSEEARFINGRWVWETSYSGGGESLTLRLEALYTNGGNNVEWRFIMSGNTGGEVFNNFVFLEGTSSLDGKSGDWQINTIGDSETAESVGFDWDIQSNTQAEVNFSFTDGGVQKDLINYLLSGAENTLTFTSSGSSGVIFWNTTTKTGYVIDGQGTKKCWDTNFQDVVCS